MKATWLGHSCFELQLAGKKVYVDPFIVENPVCPLDADTIDAADFVLVTHGHDDHYGAAVQICKQTGATLIANYEITLDAEEQGVQKVEPMNIGGSVETGSLTFHMTEAQHSSGAGLGHQCGFVVEAESESVYHAGDTGLFSDMKLINEFLEPQLALVPIGDRFTMGPESAARAVEFLGVSQVIPMHYNTFEYVEKSPAKFEQQVGGTAEVIVLEPGQTHFTGSRVD